MARSIDDQVGGVRGHEPVHPVGHAWVQVAGGALRGWDQVAPAPQRQVAAVGDPLGVGLALEVVAVVGHDPNTSFGSSE
jgi:hypothetical protein